MKQLHINTKCIVPAFILIVLGVIGAVSPSNYNWLSTIFFGSASLILVFGYTEFKKMLRPMSRPFFWKLFGLLVLAFIIKFLIASIGSVFNLLNVESINVNPAVIEAGSGSLVINLIEVLKTSVSIIGEELLVAGITLPIYFCIKKYKHGWIISNLIGCIAFGIMHITTYDFQLWSCLMVGLSRYPYTEAWRTTKSLRGGMYIHLLGDLLVLIPTAIL